MFTFYIPGKLYPANFNQFMAKFNLMLICRFTNLLCNLYYAFRKRKQAYNVASEHDVLKYLLSSR